MRVVLDTNVFISAVMSQSGASRAVLRRSLMEIDTPLFGASLIAEYEDVLNRESLFNKAPVTEPDRQQLWLALLSVSQWIRVFYLWRPNLVDETDNHLIEIAVAGNASHIITHNLRDFSHSQLAFPDIHIATPAQFIKQV